MEETSVYKHAAKNGAILSVLTIFVVVIFYALNMSFMGSLWFLLLLIVLGLGYTIYAGITYRKETGGYITFGKAYVHGLLVLVVSGAIGTIFNLLLYHVIDPDMPQMMTEAIAENAEAMMRKFGAPQNAIDEALNQIHRDSPQQFTPIGLIIQFFKLLIWYAGFALISSLFVRKNEPVEIN